MRLVRIGSIAGLAAITWDVVVLTVLHAVADVDPLRDYVSTLGQIDAPTKPWYQAAALVSGALHAIFVAGFWQAHGARRGAWITTAFLASFFLLHLAGAVVFPCDPGCALVTPTGITHYTLGVIAFVSVALAVIWHAWMARRIDPITAIAIGSSLVLLAADQSGFLRGLAERLTMAIMLVWFGALAFEMRRVDA